MPKNGRVNEQLANCIDPYNITWLASLNLAVLGSRESIVSGSVLQCPTDIFTNIAWLVIKFGLVKETFDKLQDCICQLGLSGLYAVVSLQDCVIIDHKERGRTCCSNNRIIRSERENDIRKREIECVLHNRKELRRVTNEIEERLSRDVEGVGDRRIEDLLPTAVMKKLGTICGIPRPRPCSGSQGNDWVWQCLLRNLGLSLHVCAFRFWSLNSHSVLRRFMCVKIETSLLLDEHFRRCFPQPRPARFTV